MHSTPWNVSGEEIRDEDIKLEVPGQEEEVKDVPAPEEEERGRRRFYIKTKDIAESGETPGCPGCAAAMGRGRTTRHTDECITRFSDILAKKERAVTPQRSIHLQE